MISIPMDPVFVFLLVFLRTGLLIVFFPLLGDAFIPFRVRAVTAGMISLALTPVAPLSAADFPQTVGGLAFLIGSEALLAFGVGFVARCFFAVVQFSGQVGGEQMGFSIANTIDPTGQQQSSVVAEMQYLLSVLVFFAAGLHHVFFRVMIDSFYILKPGEAAMTAGVAEFFFDLGRMIFDLTVRFAMPIIIVVFVINLALAMIGRAVPQINVFLESFPLRIIGGLFALLLSLGLLVRLWLNMFGRLGPSFQDLMVRMGGG